MKRERLWGGEVAVNNLPSNHRLAERQLIDLVNDGEWEIDDSGQIWRTSIRRGLKQGGSHLIPVKRRRVEKTVPQGYLLVRAMINRKRFVGLAHRLVWQYFNGDIPEGMIVNHKNGLKDDNRPENLELSTYSNNMSHAMQNGLKDQYGEKNPNTKLSDREVAQIRLAYAGGGYTMEILSQRFSVSLKTISQIVRGQSRIKQGGPIQDHDLHKCVCDRDPITGRFLKK